MQDISVQDALKNPVLQNILAPYYQPGAQLSQTQQETATSGQAQQTSAAEQSNLQASNPGIQATSSTQQIENLQKKAQLGLGADLQKGMDLKTALGKYAPLGLKADNIYNQYLQQRGFPNINPTDLANSGVSSAIIGKIGDVGSYADRYNVSGAIGDIRAAEDLWKKITPGDLLAYKLTGKDENINNYNIQKQIAGEHYQSAIAGASGAQATGQANVGILPDPGDIGNYAGNVAPGAFSTLEKSILNTKKYNTSDIGLPSRPEQKASATGKDILNGVLDAVKTSQQFAGVNGFNAALSTAAPLGRILGGGGKIAEAVATNAPGEIVNEAASEPSALTRLIQPGKAKNLIGQIRNGIVAAADKTGNTINGEDLAAQIRNWADNAKLGNLSNAKEIEDAATNAESLYKGKVFKPSDLQNLYDSIENGFTKNGSPRSSAEAYVDRGTQGVIAKALDNIAPGFQKTTNMFSKVYSTEKGTAGKIIKNLPQNAVKAGLNIAGLGVLRDFLGG